MTNQHIYKPLYLCLLLALTAQTVSANPLSPTVVNGRASFATAGNTLTVTNTPGTIINWQDFSIAANEVTRFAQQSASSAVLNRVTSNNPSSILGSLQSNGRVFLINPNGIVFGAGSTVDVAGLVASTLNLSNADFLAGRNLFTPIPGAANISNAGNITAQQGGQIFLIASNVDNSGVINAPNGEILLAAGSSVELVNSLDPNLRVNVTAPAGDVTNVGKLVASAGSLGLIGTVVRNSGQVSADSATLQGGKIVFKASGRADVAGTVSATGMTGGTIQLRGQEVLINTEAIIDASGNAGGGVVLVGGDAHGANPDMQNALNTYVDSTANIKADALQTGNGGKVVVWSDNSTQFNGHISARGGAFSGNGGWVEVSGKQHLGFSGLVNTLAANGITGSLLLDPTDITISTALDTVTMINTGGIFTDVATTTSNLNVNTLQQQLGLSNVTVDTTSNLLGVGNITVADSILWNSSFGLTLNATGLGSIIVNSTDTLLAPLSITNTGLGGVTMQTAGGSITLGGAINLGGGTFSAKALGTASAINVNAILNVGSGAVNLTSGGNIVQGISGGITAGVLTTSAVNGTTLNGANAVSNFSASDGGAVSLVNTAALLGLNATTSAGLIVSNTGSIAVNGLISDSAAISLTASADLNVATGGITSTGAIDLNFGASAGTLTLAAPINGLTVTATGGAPTDGLVVVDDAAFMTLGASTLTRTGSTMMSFSNVGSATLTGGISANVIDASQFLGSVKIYDTAGGDTIVGNGVNTVLAGRNVANTWDITALNSGNIGGVTNFSGVGNLVGGTAGNTFRLAGGALSGSIVGGAAGVNNLVDLGILGNSWAITGVDSGTVTGVSGGFGKIGNLTGGAGVDTFSFVNGRLSGFLTGGGGNDVLAGSTTGTINFTGGDVSSLTINSLTAGNLWAAGATTISVAGALDVATGTVTLASNSAITETAAGTITANTLVTSSAGGTTLDNVTNAIGFYNAYNTGSGDVFLNNVGTLNITGISNLAGNVTVTNAGLLTASGDIVASGAINLSATGDLNQTAGSISNVTGVAGLNDVNLSGANVTLSSVQSQRNVVLSSTGDLNLMGLGSGGYIDDTFFIYNLPFAFNYFGTSYNQAYITTNGLIMFGSGTSAYTDSLAGLGNLVAIAPAWNDWMLNASLGKDIRIGFGASDIRVRYDVVRYGNIALNSQFETVLNSNGSIKFNYGAANSAFLNDVTIGISNGTGAAIASQLMALPTFSMNNLLSTTFTPDGLGGYTEALSATNTALGPLGSVSGSAILGQGTGAVVTADFGNLSITAGGLINAISQLSALSLQFTSNGGATFSGSNFFGGITSGTNNGAGDIVVYNNSDPLTINTLTNHAGNILIDNVGGIVVNGAVSSSGTVDMTAHSPITVNNGASIISGGNMTLTAVSSATNATTDMLSIFGMLSSTGGNINLGGGSGISLGATSSVSALLGSLSAMTPFGGITNQSAAVSAASILLNSFSDINLQQGITASQNIALTSSAGAIVGSTLASLNAPSVQLAAATGIGSRAAPLQLSTNNLTANTLAGGGSLKNTPNAAVTLIDFTTGDASDLFYSQIGQSLTLTGKMTSLGGGLLIDPPTNLTMNPGSSMNSGGGSVGLWASGNILLSNINAGAGAVNINTTGGMIGSSLLAGQNNVVAGSVTARAATGAQFSINAPVANITSTTGTVSVNNQLNGTIIINTPVPAPVTSVPVVNSLINTVVALPTFNLPVYQPAPPILTTATVTTDTKKQDSQAAQDVVVAATQVTETAPTATPLPICQ